MQDTFRAYLGPAPLHTTLKRPCKYGTLALNNLALLQSVVRVCVDDVSQRIV